MNVMAIGSHPDDIEFGCAGTLIKHKMSKKELYSFGTSNQ